jgi:metal-responsive CopG/Arc/MetJ family transcriptional regulator
MCPSMVSTTYNDRTVKVGITLPNSLTKQIDKLRGDIPRSTYIRRAVEYYLKQSKVRRLLRESRHLEAPVVRAGSHNETTSPTYSLSRPAIVI